MAGHSKWANIQHRKGRQDEKRGKIWTRVIREITVAARQGGGDLSANPRLRLAVDKAKAANMPADRIKYNIDKASGALEGLSYEEIRYEGYGIAGAAIIVDCMTDNRVRTVAEVTMRPENEVELTGEDAARMRKLLDVLEDLDDTQAVYHNAAIDE